MSRRQAARPNGPRFHFFGGKGGVGKTTCSAAAALAAAETGARVLVVSTDPAHSLGDALGRPLGPRPRSVPVRRGNLRAAELDADAALGHWLGKRRPLLATIGERGTYLDREEVDRFLGLSLPGVDELVGLLELHRLALAAPHDEVVVDTAPTGHTLRLLRMPETLRRLATVLDDMLAKHRYLASRIRGEYRPDAADALVAEVEEEAEALTALLRDARQTSFSWVMLPETLSLEESRDGVAELRRAGISVREIVVNRCTPAPRESCRLCDERIRAEQQAIAAARRAFPGQTFRFLPAVEDEPRGLDPLRRFARLSLPPPLRRTAARRLRPRASIPRQAVPSKSQTPAWLAQVAPPGVKLVLFGGKGGVGKTSCAAATSLVLSEQAGAPRIELLSADPAHSLADVLKLRLEAGRGPVPGRPELRVHELDADRAFQERKRQYRQAVEDLFDSLTRGSSIDPSFDRQVVEDLLELAPPGLDELFAVLAVIEALLPPDAAPQREGALPAGDRMVILDTAPTGHGLRLLALPDAALEWVRALMAVLLKYREVVGLGRVAEDLLALSRDLARLRGLLRDPKQTRFVAVTRPAELPRLETLRLLKALRRMGVPVAAVVVNAVTPAGCGRCRREAARHAREIRTLARQCRSAAGRGCTMMVAPAVAPPPRGAVELSNWARTWQTMAR